MRYIILFLIFLPISSRADKAPELSVSDSIHQTISNSIEKTADYLDDYFTNERRNVEGSKSRVILSFANLYDKDVPNSQKLNIDVRLNLPKTENKWHLFVSNTINSLSTDQTTPFQDQTSQAVQQSDYLAALQYVIAETHLWQLSSRAGVVFRVPMDTFVRFRARRLFHLKLVDNRLVQEFYWSVQNRFIETSTVDFERLLSEKWFSRLHFSVYWGDKANEWQYVNDFGLFHKLISKLVVKYDVGYQALLSHQFNLTKVFINLRYRRNFLKKWMYFEVVPELFRDQDNWRKTRFQFLFKLDLVFGKTPNE